MELRIIMSKRNGLVHRSLLVLHSNNEGGSKGGFTLVELLVVISIIALLMAVLMPALGKAREQAKMIACLANLKQWGIIAYTYAEDNNGNLWSGSTVPADYGFWWLAQLREKDQDWKSNKIWFCPSATKPMFNESGVSTGAVSHFSAWGIETKASLDPTLTTAQLPLLGQNGISGSYGINGYALNMTTWSQNWKTINVKGGDVIPLFLEALRYDGWPVETDAAAPDPYTAVWGTDSMMARYAINRHRGYNDAVFMDGHARKVGLKELWTLKWSQTFNTAGPWTKAGHVQDSSWPDWIRSYPDY